jgi:hypothetical protein
MLLLQLQLAQFLGVRSPSTWNVGARQVFVPEYADSHTIVTVGNADGLIFYKAFKKSNNRFNSVLTPKQLQELKKQFEEVIETLKRNPYDRGALEGIVACLDHKTEMMFNTVVARNMVRVAIPTITAMIIADVMMSMELELATGGLY